MKQPTESPRACVIGHITVRDAEKWAEYRRQVPATCPPGRRTRLSRSKDLGHERRACPRETVYYAFPDARSLDGWFQSPAYQALIPLREQAADVVLIGYES